jgi:hypothetical protein
LQAEDQHGQDDQCDENVDAIALPGEGEDGKDDPGNRRGDEQQQAELNQAAIVQSHGGLDDAANATQFQRFALENVVIGRFRTVMDQVAQSSEEHHHGQPQEMANGALHLLVEEGAGPTRAAKAWHPARTGTTAPWPRHEAGP